MTGATGQLRSVKSRLKRNLVQRDQERKVRNGNVQMTNSTTLLGKPSLPATRYRLFKVFAAEARGRNFSRADLRVRARGLPTGRAGFLANALARRESRPPPSPYLLGFWRG